GYRDRHLRPFDGALRVLLATPPSPARTEALALWSQRRKAAALALATAGPAIRPQPLAVLQQRLDTNEALIDYVLVARTLAPAALVVTRAGARLVPLGASADSISAIAARLTRPLRQAYGGQLDLGRARFDLAAAALRYQAVRAPLRPEHHPRRHRRHRAGGAAPRPRGRHRALRDARRGERRRSARVPSPARPRRGGRRVLPSERDCGRAPACPPDRALGLRHAHRAARAWRRPARARAGLSRGRRARRAGHRVAGGRSDRPVDGHLLRPPRRRRPASRRAARRRARVAARPAHRASVLLGRGRAPGGDSRALSLQALTGDRTR